MTKTKNSGAPSGYDPSQFPPFAVTVDVVILTMSEGTLHVLLIRRGEAPFEGMWAVPGGFSGPPRHSTEQRSESCERRPASTRQACRSSSVPTAIPAAIPA